MPIRSRADRPWTYADYLEWSQDERWELIEGVAYDMSPAPSRRHQAIAWELTRRIGNLLEGTECRGYAAPFDVRLTNRTDARDEDIVDVVQPDIAVFCDSSRLNERGALGPPDLAIEILSLATASRDTIKKRALYERYGVKEYWIVDPEAEQVFTFWLTKGRYPEPNQYAGQETLVSKILPGLDLPVADLFEAGNDNGSVSSSPKR